MKIVILAAGKGVRMKELTHETPKPLLIYKGKNLLEHKLETLPSSVTEIIFVIGYLGEKIKEYFGDLYKTIPIRYIEQKETRGTAHALLQCKEFLNEPFIVLMGDDLYTKEDIEKLSKTPKGAWSILTYPDKPGIKAGKIVTDEKGNLKEIYEDFDGTSPYNLIYTGACFLTPDIFTKEMTILTNGEFGLPQTITKFIDEKEISVLKTSSWIRITSPEDLL
jgi:NDP-sugar pyrophosphorylase family protein